jgi:Family of unknown function (DUF6152)
MISKLLTLAGLLMVSFPTFAHHGFARYDTAKLITVKGTVTDFQFSNPHVEVDFIVKDDKGNVKRWAGQGSSPNMLARAGWNKNVLKQGDEITVSGHPAKSGANIMLLKNLTLSNGRELTPQAQW